MNEVNKHKEKDCEIMLLGNKADVAYDAVSEKDLSEFMNKHGITLFK